MKVRRIDTESGMVGAELTIAMTLDQARRFVIAEEVEIKQAPFGDITEERKAYVALLRRRAASIEHDIEVVPFGTNEEARKRYREEMTELVASLRDEAHETEKFAKEPPFVRRDTYQCSGNEHDDALLLEELANRVTSVVELPTDLRSKMLSERGSLAAARIIDMGKTFVEEIRQFARVVRAPPKERHGAPGGFGKDIDE